MWWHWEKKKSLILIESVGSINPLYQPQTLTSSFIIETRKRFNRVNNPLNEEDSTKENKIMEKRKENILTSYAYAIDINTFFFKITYITCYR